MKIADFGLARDVHNIDYYKKTTNVSTEPPLEAILASWEVGHLGNKGDNPFFKGDHPFLKKMAKQSGGEDGSRANDGIFPWFIDWGGEGKVSISIS